jgi:outer membrane lipoprotein-sorting protein
MTQAPAHWLLLGALTLTAAPAPAASLTETLAKMDQAAAKFTSLSADIKKVSHTGVIDQDTEDNGTVQMKRPKPHDIRMLFDIKPPDPKQLFIDGKKVQIFYPNSLLMQEYDMSKYKSLLEQFLLLGFGSNSRELQHDYSISLGGSEVVAGEKTTRLELIPKSQEMLVHLKRVDLWLSDETGMPVQQKFYQPGNDYQVATYTNIKINPNLPELKLDVPKGTKKEFPLK